MLWADKVKEWASSEVTKALRESCVDAIGELSYKMAYEEGDRKLAVMQGMVRAYLDIISILDNKDLEEPKGESK